MGDISLWFCIYEKVQSVSEISSKGYIVSFSLISNLIQQYICSDS